MKRELNLLTEASIESGDGYIKFPDGTMICYGTEVLEEGAQAIKVIFKRSFIEIPILSATAIWYHEPTVFVACNSIDETSMFLYLTGYTGGFTKTRSANWQAIGRWK